MLCSEELKPKLPMMKLIGEFEVELHYCVGLKSLTKNDKKNLRGGTAAFQIETGRWHGMG